MSDQNFPEQRNRIFTFFAAQSIPLGIAQDVFPTLAQSLPVTGTYTGQLGFLLTIAFFLSEMRSIWRK